MFKIPKYKSYKLFVISFYVKKIILSLLTIILGYIPMSYYHSYSESISVVGKKLTNIQLYNAENDLRLLSIIAGILFSASIIQCFRYNWKKPTIERYNKHKKGNNYVKSKNK